MSRGHWGCWASGVRFRKSCAYRYRSTLHFFWLNWMRSSFTAKRWRSTGARCSFDSFVTHASHHLSNLASLGEPHSGPSARSNRGRGTRAMAQPRRLCLCRTRPPHPRPLPLHWGARWAWGARSLPQEVRCPLHRSAWVRRERLELSVEGLRRYAPTYRRAAAQAGEQQRRASLGDHVEAL
jgi:hypothetical protein